MSRSRAMCSSAWMLWVLWSVLVPCGGVALPNLDCIRRLQKELNLNPDQIPAECMREAEKAQRKESGESETVISPNDLVCPSGEPWPPYWREHIPQEERSWVSPLSEEGPEKFMTFEFDHGGWNNIRMCMETVFVLATALGRTLVLPPPRRMYLLGGDTHSAEDFFHLQDFDRAALKIITTSEFVNNLPADISPPGSKIMNSLKSEASWSKSGNSDDVVSWLERTATIFPWTRNNQFVAFPEARGAVLDKKDARMRPFEARQRSPFNPLENHDLMQQSVLHVSASEPYRPLTHFYASIYFGSLETDRYMKRMIRDSFHYGDHLFCSAKPIVDALREEAEGDYYSAHVRRGDFQYPEAFMKADDIVGSWLTHIPAGSLVYVSTDEHDKDFFTPFHEHFRLRFLDMYKSPHRAAVERVKGNHLGMLEQIVAAQGGIFFGTWWSTFTGYIIRMRGYAGKDKLSWYSLPDYRDEMQHWADPSGAAWWREWPTCWDQIDE